MSRFEDAIAGIDAANAADPHRVTVDGGERPAALVYSERMTLMLHDFAPDASEVLQLAVRAQHLRRWTVPRSSYPEGRAGYLRWRMDLKRKHADWAAEILAGCGYSEADCARVGAIIRKDDFRSDSEVQTLEDVACLVFLQHYAADFFSTHDDDKAIGILKKTWAKMSPAARDRALGLPLSPRLTDLARRALAGVSTPGASGA